MTVSPRLGGGRADGDLKLGPADGEDVDAGEDQPKTSGLLRPGKTPHVTA